MNGYEMLAANRHNSMLDEFLNWVALGPAVIFLPIFLIVILVDAAWCIVFHPVRSWRRLRGSNKGGIGGGLFL